jgi:hypothetical protein
MWGHKALSQSVQTFGDPQFVTDTGTGMPLDVVARAFGAESKTRQFYVTQFSSFTLVVELAFPGREATLRHGRLQSSSNAVGGGEWGWTVEWDVPHEVPFARGFFVDDEAAKIEARWLLAWEQKRRGRKSQCRSVGKGRTQ